MEESRIPKRIVDGKIYVGRPVGRPRDRWLNAVTVDARLFLRTGAWRRLARDREKWKKLGPELGLLGHCRRRRIGRLGDNCVVKWARDFKLRETGGESGKVELNALES